MGAAIAGSPAKATFDAVGLVKEGRYNGFDGPWCAEASAVALRTMPVTEAAQLAADAARAVLALAAVWG